MTIEEIGILQQALERKKHQEVLRKEFRKKIPLQDIKDIFLDAFNLPTPEESKTLLEQLLDIMEQVNNEEQDTNAKLLEWSERKFQGKVNQKISGEITLSQIALTNKVEDVKKVLENIFSLYAKLCDPTLFTQDTRHRIMSFKRNLSISSTQLPKNPAQSEKHFNALLLSQSQLVVLTAEEATVRAKLTQIQAFLFPHMEILHKELGYAETLLKKDSNLSTSDGLVHLAAELAIQVNLLDVACDNWDVALKIIMEVHNPFLEKYTICVQTL